MSSSSSTKDDGVQSSIDKDTILTASKGVAKFIYRTSFPSEPTDDDYTPPAFDGPLKYIAALHGFPRAGFTNDIAALASTTTAESVEPGTDGMMDPPPTQTFTTQLFGGGGSGNNSTYIQTNVDPNLLNLEYIPPSQTSQIQYNKQDASDYIKGIATVAIIIICIYVLWGLSLLLLRCGRIDWCFRLWCCKKKRRKSGYVDDENDGGGDNEEEEDEVDQDCCCKTCRESIRAKGGCCTRNVFCGWLAGKPPTVPSKSSLEREQAMKEKKLIQGGVKAVGGGIETMNKTVMGVVKKKDDNKLKNSGGTDGADSSSGGEDVIASAQMAVAVVANEKEEDDPQDRAEQQEGEGKADDTDDNTDIIITDEYLHKRQQASRRTILVIRIIFLISAVLVIIFSIKLVVDGYQGINGIFDSIHRAIDFIADHIESIKTEVDNYIEVNQEMAQRKAEWLNRTRAQIQGGFEGKPWCPLALKNDGKIQVDISLAKLLLRGTLFKLAFVDQAVGAVDGVVETVQGQVGGVVNNTRYLNETEASTNADPGMFEQAQTPAQTAVSNTVTSAETAVTNTVSTVTEGVTNTVSSAAQSTMDMVNTVTGDVASKACMTVEECRQASEDQGLTFILNHTFDSYGCFSVEGEAVYWGEGTLEQIISPDPNDGQSATLHERVVCKAVTVAAVGVVSNVVKQQKMVVTTFLDDLQFPGGKKVKSILGKALQLKDQIGGRDLNEVDSDSDSDERIKKLVTMMTALVQSVISRVSEKVDGSDGQRSLQLQDTNAAGAVIETIVEKDGVNYTILSLSENFTGSDLIINGYNVTNLFTTNLTFEIDVATLTKLVNEKFEDSSEFLLGIFSRLQTGLNSVYDQARGAQDSLESIVPYFNVATVFVAFLILLTLFFIVGTILAWNNKQPRLFRCAQDRVILPIFILIGLFVWIFTTVFLTLGVLAGDYCFVSPDIQTNNILDQTLAQLSPIGYKFAYYYFNGCKLANRPMLMSVAYNALIGLRVGLDQFFELVNNMGEGPLRRACGLGDVTDITDGDPVNALAILVNVIRNSLGGAMTTVLAVGKLTLCKSFYPMYSFLAHQVLCTDFINLLGPMFSSLFFISIFSMIMVTMRVAWHELVEDDASGGAGDKLENGDGLENEEVAECKAMDAEDTGNAEEGDAAVPEDQAVANEEENVAK